MIKDTKTQLPSGRNPGSALHSTNSRQNVLPSRSYCLWGWWQVNEWALSRPCGWAPYPLVLRIPLVHLVDTGNEWDATGPYNPHYVPNELISSNYQETMVFDIPDSHDGPGPSVSSRTSPTNRLFVLQSVNSQVRQWGHSSSWCATLKFSWITALIRQFFCKEWQGYNTRLRTPLAFSFETSYEQPRHCALSGQRL